MALLFPLRVRLDIVQLLLFVSTTTFHKPNLLPQNSFTDRKNEQLFPLNFLHIILWFHKSLTILF